MLTSNDHAIEVCGQVAPGQDGFQEDTGAHPVGIAAMASVLSAFGAGIPTPMTTENNNEGALSIASGSDRLVDSDGRSSTLSIADRVKTLGGAGRTSTTQQGSGKETKTRSQQAAEHFAGFLSSESESEWDDSDDDQPTAPIAAEKVDQHRAAKENKTSSSFTFSGRELFDTCAEIECQKTGSIAMDQAVKEECHESPTLFLEWAEEDPDPKTLTTSLEAVCDQDLFRGKASLQSVDLPGSRKRAASAVPFTPVLSAKRLRATAEPRTI